MVVLTDEDFADLPLTTSRAIDVLEFVPAEQVDPIYFAKALLPGAGRTGDQAVRAAARRAGARPTGWRGQGGAADQREQLATLRVRDGVLVLETMLWPDEVREPGLRLPGRGRQGPPAGAGDGRVADRHAWPPTSTRRQYHDDYREALQEVIEAKVEGREVVAQPVQEEDAPAAVVDLMAALRAWVAAAKKGRGEDGRTPARQGDPAKKAAAKKARPRRRRPRRPRRRRPPAKKAAAKKAAPRKTA